MPCGGVRPIASVHDEDDPVGHDVQVVSGVVVNKRHLQTIRL